MDLYLTGKKAIVCGAATDLGLACAQALNQEGVTVTLQAHDAEELSGAAIECAGDVEKVACDIASEAGRAELLATCPEPDILINHGPGPPMGDFRNWGKSEWQKALEMSMLSAIALIQATLDGMIERGFGRIVNITSQSVKAPMANLDLSNAARAGLTGFVAGVAREKRNADVTINNLLPGLFDTQPLRAYIDKAAHEDDVAEDVIARRLLQGNPLGRFGRPDEFGAACAFLCSPAAGFICAQNILIDGGTFPGVF